MRGVFEKWGLTPFGKIDVVNFPYPRLACEITVDTAFRGRNCNGYVPLVRTPSRFSIQSHRLKPNLTRLDRNSLRSFRKF